MKNWIKNNSLTAFFTGVFLLSLPVYTIIYAGGFANTHVQSRLCLIAAYSAVLSAIIVSSVCSDNRTRTNSRKQWMIFIAAFIICGFIETIDHIVWKHDVVPLLVAIDIIMILIAAFIISTIVSGNDSIRHLMSRMIKTGFSSGILLFAFLFWPVMVYLSNLLSESAGLTVADPPSFDTLKFLVLVVESFFWYLIFGGPLNEEAGWRGFALPRLQEKFSPLMASILLGAIWGLWHVPVHLLGFYPYGAAGAVIRIFSIPLAIIFTWVYNKSNGSLIPVLVLHASINTTSLFLHRHFIVSNLVMTAVAAGITISAKMWKKQITGKKTVTSNEFTTARL